MGLTSDRELGTGSTVLVSLFVVVDDIEDLSTKPLEVVATVVWTRHIGPEHHEIGLQFSDLDADQSAYLNRFLQALAASAG